MKDDVDTGPKSLVQEINVRRLLQLEMFLEKLVESLMVKRRQLTLHQTERGLLRSMDATRLEVQR